jgi:hypothetical protein
MDDKSKLQPYGDITIVTGKYMKDGKERNRYQKIGKLFATPHFSRISIKLDAAPIGGDGWLNVFPIENSEHLKPTDDWVKPEVREKFTKKDEVVDVDDQPINLYDIPF